MRYGEFAFVLLLLFYHLALLVPRYRRPYALNFLLFAAALALCGSLAWEGLRWQSLLLVFLTVVDVVVLLVSFSRLHGASPRKGFFRSLGRILRLLITSVAFLTVAASALLFVFFPLPQVPLTGGLPVSHRSVQFLADRNTREFELHVWYPATGSTEPLPRWISTRTAWEFREQKGAPEKFWQSYLEKLPSTLVVGGKLAPHDLAYAPIVFAAPAGQNPEEWGWLLEDLASRGYVVAAGFIPPQSPRAKDEESFYDLFSNQVQHFLASWNKPKDWTNFSKSWLRPDVDLDQNQEPADSQAAQMAVSALASLNVEGSDVLYKALDFSKLGLVTFRSVPTPLLRLTPKVQAVAVLGGTIGGSSVPTLVVPVANSRIFADKPKTPTWRLDVDKTIKSADLTDSAYLRPYLAFFGPKSSPDGSQHLLVRNVLASFFQFTLWKGDSTIFEKNGPILDGVQLKRLD